MRTSRLVLLALASLLLSAPIASAQGTTGEVILSLKRDRAALAQQVRAVSDPASPQYGNFMTFAQAVEHNGVMASTQQAVLRYLRPRTERVRLDPTGLFVHAYVNLQQAYTLFGVAVHEPTPGVLIADGTPEVPKALRSYVDDVTGLVDISATRAGMVSTKARALTTGSSPKRTGTPAGCTEGVAAGGFTPNQIRTAYGFSNNGGQGRHIVLFEVGQNYDPAFVRDYAKCFGLRMPSLHKREVGIGADPSEAGDLEVLLDIEAIMGVLPKLSRLDVMIGHATTPFPAVLAAAINPSQVGMSPPDAISVSYGICETVMDNRGASRYGSVPLWEDVAGIAALMGTSVVVSAGDSGSSGCLRQQTMAGSFGAALSKAVAYPSTAQNVTSVGGTGMALNARNAIVAQRPWNTRAYGGPAYGIEADSWLQESAGSIVVLPGTAQALQKLGAGGGGTSTRVTSPWYQRSLGSSQRLVPDVAMFADESPGITVLAYVDGTVRFVPVGGTSYAAPLTAAAIAATNEVLTRQGGHRLGFVNPLLYSATSVPVAQRPFIDIAGGSNDLAQIGCCIATKGYDKASGLGTLNVPALTRWAESRQ